MNWIPEKLRTIRQEFKMTQLELAQASGLSQRDISQLENGRKEGLPKEYIQFLHSRGVDLNWLFADPAAAAVPAAPGSAASKKYALPDEAAAPTLAQEDGGIGYGRPAVSVSGAPLISMVAVAAAPEYAQRHVQPAFVQSLPVCSLPLPELRQGTFRCFQLADASMAPALQPQDWIIAHLTEAVPAPADYGVAYVVVTKQALLVTRLIGPGSKVGTVTVKADAGAVATELLLQDISELWRVIGCLSFQLTPVVAAAERKVTTLEANLQDLLDRVQRLEQGR